MGAESEPRNHLIRWVSVDITCSKTPDLATDLRHAGSPCQELRLAECNQSESHNSGFHAKTVGRKRLAPLFPQTPVLALQIRWLCMTHSLTTSNTRLSSSSHTCSSTSPEVDHSSKHQPTDREQQTQLYCCVSVGYTLHHGSENSSDGDREPQSSSKLGNSYSSLYQRQQRRMLYVKCASDSSSVTAMSHLLLPLTG